jgi:hypothetical protein
MRRPTLWVWSMLLLLALATGVVPAGAAVAAESTVEWTVEDVQAWALAQGLEEDVAGTLARWGVDGAVLLNVDENDVREDLKISGLKAKKLLAAVQKLRDQFRSKTNPDGTVWMNFHQYRALNRNAMDSMVPALFGVAPRFALTILNEFPEHGKPKEEDGWITWLFWPQYYIFCQADNICGGLPIMLKISILFALLRQFLEMALAIGLYVSGEQSVPRFFRGPLEEMGSALSIILYRNFIYPIVPWFICDMVFYFQVYFGPLFMIFQGVKAMHRTLTHLRMWQSVAERGARIERDLAGPPASREKPVKYT